MIVNLTFNSLLNLHKSRCRAGTVVDDDTIAVEETASVDNDGTAINEGTIAIEGASSIDKAMTVVGGRADDDGATMVD